jgi:hypothetical protein
MWRCIFIPRVFGLLAKTWIARRNLGRKPLTLPPVARSRSIDDNMIERQVRLADAVISRVAAVIGHPCFYRSVILASLLRPQGVPVVVNIGGRSLSSSSKMKAHSWLTLEGSPFYELPNSIDLYTFDMGQNVDKSVRYWIGPDLDESVLLSKNVTRGNTLRVLSRQAQPRKGS